MAGAPRWAAPTLFCLLLVGFAAGIRGSYRAVFLGRGLYRVSGIFQSRSGDTLFLVAHEQVPGLMAPMGSMAFVADSKKLLDRAALAPGDRIRLAVRQSSGELRAMAIEKVR